MDKIMWKEAKKRQILIILGLSVLVLVCLMIESWRRGAFSKESGDLDGENLGYESAESEDKNTKKKRITEDTKVRVLLNTTNFTSLYHKSVKITSKNPFYVTIGKKTKKYPAGKKVSFQMIKKSLKKKTITISPVEGGRLQILTISRQNANPSYRGTIQLRWMKNGFLLINELLLEEYLYAVVPSELSTSNHMEALKAQAVCARSYAYQQINSNRYEEYYADLEDSVDCQVYNNVPEDERSRKAVDSTRGMVVANQKNKVIHTYYYSTSWGHSASGKAVWNTKSEVGYLQDKLQITEKSRKKTGISKVNLADESSFRKFIQNNPYDTYDSDAEWYRWEVMITEAGLSNRVDAALESCYVANQEYVLTQKADGSYKQESLKPVGEIKKLRVEKREKSGLVTELVIVGRKNVVKVCTQYNIRKVLAPLYESISYNNGKAQTTMSMLPSAAFYIVDAVKENEPAFQFVGGGFGHGAGMSQCGAKDMAESGKSCEEIITHYFEGTKLLHLSEVSQK